jgi:hypothetical protein
VKVTGRPVLRGRRVDGAGVRRVTATRAPFGPDVGDKYSDLEQGGFRLGDDARARLRHPGMP